MCAIAGLISRTTGLLAGIDSMTTLMRHRGPDDAGYLAVSAAGTACLGAIDTPAEVFAADMAGRPVQRIQEAIPMQDGWLALGHRRLAIVDLSPLGHQPMCYADRYWIVFNGEVYNHLELRAELEAAGCRFVSHSDTEVILAAYAMWGLECFARFNGMWAMAIYDARKETLVLSRDRFGVKPLYYWMGGESLAFASEIKAFTGLPNWRPRVNDQAVHDFFLSSMQDHSRETMFDGVFQLEPGTHATLNCGEWRKKGRGAKPELNIQRWYQLKAEAFHGNFEDAAGRFQWLLADSVKLRLRADVPVGSCLSGGLDSSAIVCLADYWLGGRAKEHVQKTFSACSEIKRFDEREFVDVVVAATRAEAHYEFPTIEDLLAVLDELVWHQDEPFATTSIYAQWCVFRRARQEGVKVMLDGQGADESLFGYANFFRAFASGLVRSGHWQTAWAEMLAKRGSARGALSCLLRAATDAATPAAWQRKFRSSAGRRSRRDWLNSGRLSASFPGPLADRFQQPRSGRELSMNLLTGAHVQMLLHWEDRNSMAHSIESRVPFLDYRLVEFILGLPGNFKIRNGVSKAVMRRGLKSVVPDKILQRRDKMGFVTPEEVWARERAVPQFREALADAVTCGKGLLTPGAMEQFEKMVSGKAAYDSCIWRMICFGRWVRKFGVAVG